MSGGRAIESTGTKKTSLSKKLRGGDRDRGSVRGGRKKKTDWGRDLGADHVVETDAAVRMEAGPGDRPHLEQGKNGGKLRDKEPISGGNFRRCKKGVRWGTGSGGLR